MSVELAAQTALVASLLSLAGVGIALYSWSERKNESFLLFWALAWGANAARWIGFYFTLDNPGLRPWLSTVSGAAHVCFVLGGYELLPKRRFRRAYVVIATCAVLAAFSIAGWLWDASIAMEYVRGVAVLAVITGCMAWTYAVERLPGYAFAAVTTTVWAMFATSQLVLGENVASNVLVPMFNLPLLVSILLIAYQRNRRQLEQSERTLRSSTEQTRELYARLSAVEDDERRALHRELHDQVGANLSALRIEVELIGTQIDRGEFAAARLHLQSVEEVAQETIGMARDLLAELRPPALDEYGLLAALRNFAEAQGARLGLQIDVEGEDRPLHLEASVESALFRIAREALVNAAKHASATRVRVSLAEQGGRVALSIEDDGVGFDPATPAPGHWGLESMSERARAIGGTLRIESGPSQGTCVTVHVGREAA